MLSSPLNKSYRQSFYFCIFSWFSSPNPSSTSLIKTALLVFPMSSNYTSLPPQALHTKKEQEASTSIKQETMKLKHLSGVKAQADKELKKVNA